MVRSVIRAPGREADALKREEPSSARDPQRRRASLLETPLGQARQQRALDLARFVSLCHRRMRRRPTRDGSLAAAFAATKERRHVRDVAVAIAQTGTLLYDG